MAADPQMSLKKPCAGCPFTSGRKAVRLLSGRIREIAWTGGSFICHQTVDHDAREDEGYEVDGDVVEMHGMRSGEKYCAGAIIFAERQGKPTQMMRIMYRLGLYDPEEYLKHKKGVYTSLRAMLASALERGEK